MAGDRAYADADDPDDAGPDRHFRRLDATPEPTAPAEPRSYQEYYEALRAADGRSAESGDAADGGAAESRIEPCTGSAESRPGSERSGWDSVDAADRPPPEAIRVSTERRGHILDGDPDGNGGGHRHGAGKPGKTEFPATWDDEKIIASVLDVGRRPDKPPIRQDWNDTWLCSGTRDNVVVYAVVEHGGDILTGWPEEGSPGVVRNPRRGSS